MAKNTKRKSTTSLDWTRVSYVLPSGVLCAREHKGVEKYAQGWHSQVEGRTRRGPVLSRFSYNHKRRQGHASRNHKDVVKSPREATVVSAVVGESVRTTRHAKSSRDDVPPSWQVDHIHATGKVHIILFLYKINQPAGERQSKYNYDAMNAFRIVPVATK